MSVSVQPAPARFSCTESFARHTQAYGQMGKGKIHELALSPDLPRHHVWIAAGAFKQEGAADEWKITASLRFFKSGSVVGELPINTASEVRSFEQPLLAGLLAAGSRQPALRYQVQNNFNLAVATAPDQRGADNAGALTKLWNAPAVPTTWHVSTLDIPCFEVVCHADSVQYIVTEREPDTFGSDAIRLLTGLRILSMNL
jgi:hypothetical protein